jgi:hypothetical protein
MGDGTVDETRRNTETAATSQNADPRGMRGMRGTAFLEITVPAMATLDIGEAK